MAGIRALSSPFSFGGMRVITDETLKDHVGWDFSRCRSPSRAKRRFKRFGARSKMVREITRAKPDAYRVGDMFVMHPDVWRELQRRTNLADATPKSPQPILYGAPKQEPTS
jgi:hypothetical protein